MDRDTLLAHRPLWVREDTPHAGRLVHLDQEEQSLFDDLQQDRLGEKVRREQERIGFGWVERELGRV
jgi:hypothetical protein